MDNLHVKGKIGPFQKLTDTPLTKILMPILPNTRSDINNQY